MTRWRNTLRRSIHVACALALALYAAPSGAAPQEARPTPPSGGAGVDREAMWPAPTADDWKKPCLIAWQRTWDDAVALSRETARPILVCVNMDGEIASEHYAGVRYRQADIAALYEPYICVIASTYRHTPRDYDDEGRRVECPRFGTVTCGEHIWIEPLLYEKFLDGKRIAPRHIMVELDGSESYDVYYAWDTASVFETIRKGVTDREGAPPFVERGDRSLVERVGSPDAADKARVEEAFTSGDADLRRRLVEQAATNGSDASLDLLRLAVFGVDADVAREARAALADAQGPASVDLINQALRAPLDAAERERLIAALERLGSDSPRARLLGVVHRGLQSTEQSIDVGAWSAALRFAPTLAAERTELEARLSAASRAATDGDASSQLDLALDSLALARAPTTTREFRRLLALDARAAVKRAAELGATGWRVDAAQCLVAQQLGERQAAFELAERTVAALPEGADSWSASAVLALFADGRRAAIDRAVRRGEDWPAQWLADLHAAQSILLDDPTATDERAVSHYDFLWRLGASEPAARVLDASLVRFPGSFELHARLRGRLLFELGATGLESSYARRLTSDAAPLTHWFAAYASLIAAEVHRRAADGASAHAAYERARTAFEEVALQDPQLASSSAHYAALCLAGRARIELESGALDSAVALLIQSLERAPSAAGSLDGLNLSPSDTSRSLRARLIEAGRVELVASLDAALAKIDPALLELPAFEREPGATPSRPPGPPRSGG